MQELMQHVLAWLCPNGTNFRNILNTRKALPELANHQILLHNRTFMPKVYISTLKDQTFPIYVFPFEGMSCKALMFLDVI